MTDAERQYLEKMQWYEVQLQNIHKQVQDIADEQARGALARAPGAYKNPELFKLQERLIERADEIIDSMQALHRAFNQQGSKE